MTDKKSLTIGDEVKITGGKYKKMGEGILQTLKNTYCDVAFKDGDETIVKKVKIDYIHRINEGVIEMPDVDDLVVCENPEQYAEESKKAEEKIKEQVMKILNEETGEEEPNLVYEEEPQVEMKMEDLAPEEQDFVHQVEELENRLKLVEELNRKCVARNEYLELILGKILSA